MNHHNDYSDTYNHMLNILKDIPNIQKNPLNYIFEDMKLQHIEDTLWLNFGIDSNRTINYISQFTKDTVYGFDNFRGLPTNWNVGHDKGFSNRFDLTPSVNDNVVFIRGYFDETLPEFIKNNNKKISFIHIDTITYSSTKYILDTLKNNLSEDCVIVFDELVNYLGFDGESGELKAFYEFITENVVDYEWIGMYGSVDHGLPSVDHRLPLVECEQDKIRCNKIVEYNHDQPVCLVIHKIKHQET
jgi:hypothetical protein